MSESNVEKESTFLPEMEREDEILLLQRLLNVKFPGSYRDFLLNRGHDFVNRLLILGLPIDDPKFSVLGATQRLRKERSDLPKFLIAIRLLDTRALCLDLENGSEKDAPLVEVYLDSAKKPMRVHDSFEKYIKDSDGIKKSIMEEHKRFERLRKETEEYKGRKFDHKGGFLLKGKKGNRRKFDHKGGLLLKGKEEVWRVVRSCLHDVVIGRFAFRPNRKTNSLEVGAFLVTDHPEYEEGHGIRSIAVEILSEAYRSGLMEITFTRDGNPRELPQELTKLGEKFGIVFEIGSKGRILHNEAIKLYANLIGLPFKIQEALKEGTHGLTIEAVCYVIASGIWTLEETMWLFSNSPRPEGIILGTDLPEDRLFYLESISYGRAALAVTMLQQKILVDLSEKFSFEEIECLVEPKGRFWSLKSNQDFLLPWFIENNKIVKAGQELLILSSPRHLTFKDRDILWIQSNLELLKESGSEENIRCLLLSTEFKNLDEMRTISEKEALENGIYILLPSFTCDELDEEVNKRIVKARSVRR